MDPGLCVHAPRGGATCLQLIPSRLPHPKRDLVTPETVCRIAQKWRVKPLLVHKVIEAQGDLPFDLWIFSGARAREKQEEISGTPFDVSTHADTGRDGCPRLATGVDVQPVSPGIRVINAAVAQMGAAMVLRGLRWGGGAPVTDAGIPVGNERWHVDLGPRSP